MPKVSENDLINKMLVGAMIGLLGWNLYTTQQLTVDFAVMTEKIEQIEERLK